MAFVIKYIKKLIIMHKDMMTLYVYHKMENFVDRKGGEYNFLWNFNANLRNNLAYSWFIDSYRI